MTYIIIIAVVLLIGAALLIGGRHSNGEGAQKAGFVTVEFLDRDGNLLAKSKVPVEQLPETFRIDTTFELLGKEWSVATAEPLDKVEFSRTQHLRVTLHEIVMMPPGDLLYSLPTISDECGVTTGATVPHDGLYQVSEDDWRQVEFVSAQFRAQVELELADIAAVRHLERVGIGYKRVHIRARIPEPLALVRLSRSAAKVLFPPEQEYEAVSFHRTPGSIAGSFAWRTEGGSVFWGVADNPDTVLWLGMHEGPKHDEQFEGRLVQLMSEQNLLLVDWCTATLVESNEESIGLYFSRRSNQPEATESEPDPHSGSPN